VIINQLINFKLLALQLPLKISDRHGVNLRLHSAERAGSKLLLGHSVSLSVELLSNGFDSLVGALEVCIPDIVKYV
jgi:hypothetical protein